MNNDREQWVLDPLTDRELEILQHIAEGNSDQEIAQQLFLSVNTIKWHNRRIYSKLGVSGRKQAVSRASELDLLDTKLAADERGHNLPAPVTSFVGREREVAEVQALLADTRLLTLCGPPGTGKTRLALRVASKIIDQFEDGAFFVDLAPITDPQLVATTIAEILRVKEAGNQTLVESLRSALCDRQALLLLDNFEQVIEIAPLLADLLAAAPDLKIMVTSREILHIYGEQIYPVPPLALPDLERLETLEYLNTIEAIDLFLHRARSVKHDFVLNEENAHAVAETCTRLDGLPLAIELAAARVHTLSPQALVTRLENRLDMLVGGMRDLPPRHQTLNATIAWSYDLLGEGEQQLLARLAAFQGGRTVEATEVVCGPRLSIDVLNGLESLLSKSLLQVEDDPTGEPRFTMLETIHEYARLRLAESGEEEVIRRRHAEYFNALAWDANKGLVSPDEVRWLQRVTAEHDNMRTALNWALVCPDDHMLALRLVGALQPFWMKKCLYREGLQWCERALEQAENAPPDVLGWALNTTDSMIHRMVQSKTPETLARRRELNEQQLVLASESDDQELIFWAYYRLGRVAYYQRDYNRAKQYWNNALTVSAILGDYPRIHIKTMFGWLAEAEGDYELARKYYEKSLALARKNGPPSSISFSLGNLGEVARHLGDIMGAANLQRESLLLDLSLGLRQVTGGHLAYMGSICLELGRPEKAARLLGAAEAYLEATAGDQVGSRQHQFDRDMEVLQAQLSADRLAAALAEGRAMDVEEAIDYALRDE